MSNRQDDRRTFQLGHDRSQDLEAATGRRPVNTVLLHRGADNLGKQGFCDKTCLWMSGSSGGKRAAVPANKVFAFALFKRRGSSQVLKNAESGFDSLFPGFALDLQQV